MYIEVNVIDFTLVISGYKWMPSDYMSICITMTHVVRNKEEHLSNKLEVHSLNDMN